MKRRNFVKLALATPLFTLSKTVESQTKIFQLEGATIGYIKKFSLPNDPYIGRQHNLYWCVTRRSYVYFTGNLERQKYFLRHKDEYDKVFEERSHWENFEFGYSTYNPTHVNAFRYFSFLNSDSPWDMYYIRMMNTKFMTFFNYPESFNVEINL